MPGSCGILLAQYGLGRVLLSTSHPESTDPDHTGFLYPRMIAEAAHCVSSAQPSEAARLAEFVQNQNGWQGQPLEESKHLYGKRLVSQPRVSTVGSGLFVEIAIFAAVLASAMFARG